MRNKLLILFFICSSIAASAQLELLKKEVTSKKAKVNLVEGFLDFSNSFSELNNEVVNVSNIALVDKEIIINYKSKPLKNGQYFFTKLEVRLDGELLAIEPENLYEDYNKKINFSEVKQSHEIIWTNLMEEYINIEGDLEMTMIVEIYGTRDLPYNVDCSIKPSFTKKQKTPFLIAGVLGAGSVLTGEYLKRKSDDDYETYLSQETFDVAEPFYQSANKNAKRGEIFTIAGASVLAVDAIWFFIKQRRFKKQLDTYNEFCNPEKINVQPRIGFESGSNKINSGLTITLNF